MCFDIAFDHTEDTWQSEFVKRLLLLRLEMLLPIVFWLADWVLLQTADKSYLEFKDND